MLLAIDIGNTKIKAAVFEGNAIADRIIFEKKIWAEALKIFFSAHPEINQVMLSSVDKNDEALELWLQERVNYIKLGHDSVFPFTNKYATPGTLGIDRMVLTAGAMLCFPKQNCLVIDAGTCITYDFIDALGNYFGGAISPGLQLRYNSMHNFTAKLPLLYPEMPQHYIGNTTSASMHSGVVYGVIHEIEGFVRQYNEQYQDVKIILTGGDADFLAKRLKSTIFANPIFLLESLNQLYLYTIKK